MEVLILNRTFLIFKVTLWSFMEVVVVGGLKFHYFKSFRQMDVFRDLIWSHISLLWWLRKDIIFEGLLCREMYFISLDYGRTIKIDSFRELRFY